MKKIVMLLAAALLCVSLAACGGSPAQEQPSTPESPTNNLDNVITVQLINEVFAANENPDICPEITAYHLEKVEKYINIGQQYDQVKKNWETGQFKCLYGPEIAIKAKKFKYKITSGIDIVYTVEEVGEDSYLVSGDMIASYDKDAHSDKRVGFSFTYSVANKKATDLTYTASEPLTCIPTLDLSFDSKDEFAKMLVPITQSGVVGKVYNGENYKAEDISEVEILYAELSDDPNYDLLMGKHYHVLITLTDGRRIYSEFDVDSFEGSLTARETLHGIEIE